MVIYGYYWVISHGYCWFTIMVISALLVLVSHGYCRLFLVLIHGYIGITMENQ